MGGEVPRLGNGSNGARHIPLQVPMPTPWHSPATGSQPGGALALLATRLCSTRTWGLVPCTVAANGSVVFAWEVGAVIVR